MIFCANLLSVMEKSLFENLKAVLFRYRIRFFKGFLMLLISNFLLVFNPLVFRQAVFAFDPASSEKNGFFGKFFINLLGPYYTSLYPWAILLITIAAISAFFKYWMRMTFITVSREVEMEIRSKLFGRIQEQSMNFFDHHGTGELLSRLTNDIAIYREVLGPGIMYPLFSLTVVLPGIIALFIISKSLALISLIPLLIIPFVNFLVGSRIYKTARLVQEKLGDMSNLVQEFFSAIRIIKSFVAEKVTLNIFSELSEKMKWMNLRLFNIQGSLFPFFVLLTKIITVLLVLFSGMIILNDWGELTAADFVSFMWIQSYIFFPVLMLGWLVPVYERGRAAYERLVQIYNEPIEVREKKAIKEKIEPGASITFKNLNFTYPLGKEKAIDNINLEIAGGSFVGITGPIGSGKTTLFKLLNREYEVPPGMILIDDIDIHGYPLKAFQAAFVTVEQVPFLFSKSIAENVRFGKREATLSEVEEALLVADFHETILEFPEQYQTVIGERGVTLSGGQRQRLALARAFLVNRSTLLLDDIFSNVDAATEKRIFHAMKKSFEGKTIILISHRASVLNQMDKVIYMQDGKIIEEGSPKELYQMGGHYKALLELQKG